MKILLCLFFFAAFRPDAEFMGREKVSTSSLHYDDIDEVAEVQPLTSPGFTAAPPRDKYLPEEALDQQDGKFEPISSQSFSLLDPVLFFL